MTDVLIIGAGPAGAACALWLNQLKCKVLLIEATSQAGGLQAKSPYPNYWFPSVQNLRGQDVAENIHNHLEADNVPMRLSCVAQHVDVRNGGFVTKTNFGDEIESKFLVLATGTRFRTGGFTPTERIIIGPGRGESMGVAGKSIAILGGGDNAFDALFIAKNNGASHAWVFARSVRAQSMNIDRAPKDCLTVGPYVVDELAMTVNGQPFDFINIQYGFEPVIPKGLEALALTTDGHVLADHWGVTSVAGIYAIGELANTFHPCAVTSMAHGIQASKHIHRLIESRSRI